MAHSTTLTTEMKNDGIRCTIANGPNAGKHCYPIIREVR